MKRQLVKSIKIFPLSNNNIIKIEIYEKQIAILKDKFQAEFKDLQTKLNM